MATVPQFDYYVVSRILGEGGMGIVYLATDRRTDLPVAIKVMSKRMNDPEVQFRFMRENEILAALNHRNIVRCYEITRARDGTPCIVMEYLRGSDFRAFEGRPYPELIPLMIQTLLGMEYLRQQKIVHRDLSSNNLLVVLENEKRLVKILDFGIAKILHETPLNGEMNTQTGQFLGKFSFAAPELFFATAADWRSDVYSLGVVFFRLLTQHPPIRVERTGNFYEWMMAHQRPFEPSFDVPAGMPALPEDLRNVLLAMLARDPAERPESYHLVLEWLDAIQRRAVELGLEPDPTEVTRLPQPVEEGASSRPSGANADLDRRGTPSDSRPRTPGPPPLPAATPSPRRGGTGEVGLWADLPTTPERSPGRGPADPGEAETARFVDLVRQVSAARPVAPPPLARPPAPPARPAPPDPVPPAGAVPRAGSAGPGAPRRAGGPGAGRNRFIDLNASLGMSASSSRPLPAVTDAGAPPSLARVALLVAGILVLFGAILLGLYFLLRPALQLAPRSDAVSGRDGRNAKALSSSAARPGGGGSR